MPTQLPFMSGGVSIRMHAEEFDSGSNTAQPKRPAVLLLHGSGGNVDFWASRLSPFLHEGGISLYAPHYFDRTGTTRADLVMMNDGIHVPQWIETLDAALHFVASRPAVDPERIVLAGISLGAFLALAFAAELSTVTSGREHRRIRALLDVSGGLVEPYASRATVHFPPTLILHGATDSIVPVSYAQDLDRRLTQLGVSHRSEIFPGEGHWFSAGAFPRMLLGVSSFLQQHLSL
jgi:dienelactone hydrolase